MRPAVLFFAPLLLLPLLGCDGYLTEPEAASVAEIQQDVLVPNPPDYTGKTAKTINLYHVDWSYWQLVKAYAYDNYKTYRKLEMKIEGSAGTAFHEWITGEGSLVIEATPPYPADKSNKVTITLYTHSNARPFPWKEAEKVVCVCGVLGNTHCHRSVTEP